MTSQRIADLRELQHEFKGCACSDRLEECLDAITSLQSELAEARNEVQSARATQLKAVMYLEQIEQHCPCGARPESPNTHPHVGGCPVAAAIAAMTASQKPEGEGA